AEGGDPRLDAPTRALIRQLLAATLARLADRDELRAVRERYRMLSEASFEGILIHVGGVPIEVNQRMCEMLGRTLEEMHMPDTMLRCVAPEDYGQALARIRARVEGEFPVTLVRKDGSRFPAEFCTKQTQLGDQPLRVVALRDVTLRERAARLMRESETRLRQILEATFDGVVLSRGGRIVDMSGAMERYFGLPRDELIGRRVVDLVAPSARDDVQQRISEQVIGRYETTVIGPGGELIPTEIISVNSTLDGEPVRVAGVRDLRAARLLEQQRRHLELRAERSQRLQSLGVLAGGIAHDFNNLLVGVMGGAELLESQLEGEQRATAQMIRIAGERASSLTKQLLVYSGRRDVGATEALDLSSLLPELRGLLGAALSKKAQLELDLEPKTVVLGERATLTQVLMNLLVNASDALEDEAGTIRVSARHVSQPDARWDEALGANVKPGDWVLVEVSDSGAGMDQATQRRIFEPFYTTKATGHGLGLGTCLGIVAAHGGAIHVSSAVGQGSTFSVMLPAAAADGMEHVERNTGMRLRPCRVLVVDDEPLVRQHLRRLLELRGFSVSEATDGRSGIAAATNSEPDVILLDLSMPDLDGVTVIRNLRAAGSRARVVLCSGNLDYAAERGLESGLVQGVLQKPFSTDELIEAIERART
ncbi:MAG TPA: response regulator, partial [Polyangiales bacterium]|nr:response regulator [Polyangiales bacterium]